MRISFTSLRQHIFRAILPLAFAVMNMRLLKLMQFSCHTPLIGNTAASLYGTLLERTMATPCPNAITGFAPSTPGPRARGLPGRILAAPSWVMPGTVAENCDFLATLVDEISLLFMESAACLAYGRQDLPDSLADLPLSYHLHLPLDLPMSEPARAAGICAELLDKAAYLPVGAHWRAGKAEEDTLPARQGEARGRHSPAMADASRPRAGGAMRGVLHPPDHDPADPGLAGRLLAAFAETWLALGREPAHLLLENTRGNDLTGLAGPIREYGFGLCLDIGHVLAYGQEKLLRRPSLLRRVDMLHVNAPGKGRRAGEHLPLTNLDASGQKRAARICQSVPARAVIMMELFSWRHIEESLPLIQSWL